MRRAGLAALCLLVSWRFVWYRGALRSLRQCRCECKLVCPGESLSSRVIGRAPVVQGAYRLAVSHGGSGTPVPIVPLPIRSIDIIDEQ